MRPESRRIPARTTEALLMLSAILFAKPTFAMGNELARVADTHALLKSPTPVAVKKGVVLHGLDAKMHTAIHKAGRIWMRHGKVLVVTSGLDGRHKKGSLHYAGLAVDLRSRYFAPSICKKVTHELQRSLGGEFQVIREKHHIHVEYDP
ncbi:hypothetical protein [Methylocaldum szegediense]|uniref:Peptidase M15A C-terminal domain-containing protein n=1 Tax=Methylocaldum szegediense TaxID=73780 RepID=A0ABM9I8N5_9GAMM|nr:hypothetical protein [Methylocaldum szegediense]CAI8958993.1 conserved protein of unknown function [Methylocaldum szegediense]